MTWRCRFSSHWVATLTTVISTCFAADAATFEGSLDGRGMSLYAKRLERGRFILPTPADGSVAITAAQLGYMLEGIDWVRRETGETGGESTPR